MTSRHKLEDRIQQIRLLRTSSTDIETLAVLRKALHDRASLIVAEAAKTTAALRLSSLTPDLLSAFERLFDDPVKRDPKCWGKTAIAKTLVELDYDQSAPFVRGLRHIQMEPVWGGQEDAAPKFRATCALALVQCSDLLRIEKLRHLVEALSDSADPVRVEAVRALAQMGGDEPGLLLRLKALSGDKRPVITGHVFDAILGLERDSGLEFVAGFLKSPDFGARDEAALALGASRLPLAVRRLIAAWNEGHDREFGSVILRSLSSSRDAAAIGFLLDLVTIGASHDMLGAMAALKIHEGSPEIWQLVERARESRS